MIYESEDNNWDFLQAKSDQRKSQSFYAVFSSIFSSLQHTEWFRLSSYIHLCKSVNFKSAISAVMHAEMQASHLVQEVTCAYRTLKCTHQYITQAPVDIWFGVSGWALNSSHLYIGQKISAKICPKMCELKNDQRKSQTFVAFITHRICMIISENVALVYRNNKTDLVTHILWIHIFVFTCFLTKLYLTLWLCLTTYAAKNTSSYENYAVKG